MFDPDRFERELGDALAGDQEIDVVGSDFDREIEPRAFGTYDPGGAHEQALAELGDEDELGDDDGLEHELEAELACRYQPGEIALSRTAEGVLPTDVYPHPRGGYVIADFGVARRSPKPGAVASPVLARWLASLGGGRPVLEIVGYTDCAGAEGTNQRLRIARAKATRAALGSRLAPATKVSASEVGSWLWTADNTTSGGRAMNRGVWLRVPDRNVDFGNDAMVFTGRRPSPPPTSIPWDRTHDGDPVAWVVKGAHPPSDRSAVDAKAFLKKVIGFAKSTPGPAWFAKLAISWFDELFGAMADARKMREAYAGRRTYAMGYARTFVRGRDAANASGVPATRDALVERLAPSVQTRSPQDLYFRAGQLAAIDRMAQLLASGGGERLRGLLRALPTGDDPTEPGLDNLEEWLKSNINGLPQ